MLQALRQIPGPLCAPDFNRKHQKSPAPNAGARTFLIAALLQPCRTEDVSTHGQRWAFTRQCCARIPPLSTFPAYTIIREARDVRFRLNLQWTVNNSVTSLHCFMSKAIRSLDNFSIGPSNSGCSSPIFGVLLYQPRRNLKPTNDDGNE